MATGQSLVLAVKYTVRESTREESVLGHTGIHFTWNHTFQGTGCPLVPLFTTSQAHILPAHNSDQDSSASYSTFIRDLLVLPLCTYHTAGYWSCFQGNTSFVCLCIEMWTSARLHGRTGIPSSNGVWYTDIRRRYYPENRINNRQYDMYTEGVPRDPV
jgi:hypothetical protein